MTLEGQGFLLRPAEPEDAEFLAGLASHEEVDPFIAASSAREVDAFRAEIERARGTPDEYGRFVIEVEWHASSWRAGTIAFSCVSRRSRIADLFGLMLHPDFRGRGLALEATRLFARHLIFDLGFHRVELECYGFNDRAIRHFERAGFVREGTKRKAYWRHGEWTDGVLFGLVREDFGEEA